jgi:hypothetical protein
MRSRHFSGLTRRELAQYLAGLTAGFGWPNGVEAQTGRAASQVSGETVTIFNPYVNMRWSAAGGRLRALEFSAVRMAPDLFTLVLAGGRTVRSSEMIVTGRVETGRVAGDAKSIQRAGQRSAAQVSAAFRDELSGATVKWRAVLLDGSRYLRQEFEIAAGAQDLPIREIALWDCELPGVQVVGTVKGSPAVAGQTYLAFEHPLSSTTVTASHVRCVLSRQLPVRTGQSFACSSVIGRTAPGQLRRGFLEYVEDQRAHPYRTFLHYNSWYDIGYFSKYDEAAALDRVGAFGRELSEKRGVTLDSFLLDDGWDDPASLWEFHSGFPKGLTNLAKAAAQYRAAMGVWLSPWGGYGKPKQDRVNLAAEEGFEIQDGGFALSGPKYYQRFRDVCQRMIADFGVNQFKFDGTGNANRVVAGSRFDSDFDAAITLIADLRKAKPDLYVNLTTGTYPSPFWLRYADSIWRGGEDHSFAGVGTWRQKWTTYRDAGTYRHVVKAGPLYPINSLMLHGMIYAAHAKNLDSDPAGDFRSEVRSYFGTGTQLQEMYVSPNLLTAANWDDLAEAARWSRNNAATLVDTHWVGGDPAKLAIYGWAAWSVAKGILSLRNPSDQEQTLTLDIGAAFELPPNAPRRYRVSSPWKSDAGKPAETLQVGTLHVFHLAPFEVVNLEAVANS